jgi:hypothetical protein
MSLGDGLFDATTLLRVEGWRKPEERHVDYMLRERQKIINALDRLEYEAPQFAREEFHIGHVCIAGGLSYLELRNPIHASQLVPGDATYEWRAGRPRLAEWFEGILSRPSIAHRVSHPDYKG